MLPRSIYKLYDNVPDPPPTLYGAYYANDLAYVIGTGTTNPHPTTLFQTCAFKYTTEYCPYVKRSIPKWLPYQELGDACIQDPHNVYDNENNGVQGVSLLTRATEININENIWQNWLAAILTERASGDVTQYPTGNQYGYRSSIIVGMPRECYVFVPRIKAVNSAGQSQLFYVDDYENSMTSYPYIVEISGGLYYKEDVNSSDSGVDTYFSMICNGRTPYALSMPYGTHNMYNSNYQYMVKYGNAFPFDGMTIFCTPPIYGHMYSSSALRHFPSYEATSGTFQGGVGTHSIDIMQFVNLTPPGDLGEHWDNFNSLWYITYDTAIKIINSIGFIWVENISKIPEYMGINTVSDEVHMPVVNADGSTTPNMWTGSDISLHWEDNPQNSDFFSSTGDMLTGDIDLLAPVDKTNETNTKELDEDTDELFPATPLLNGLGVFANYYAMTNTDVLGLSDFLWNADETIIDDVINTLKLFGQNPINAIMSLRLYPFNIYDLLPSHTVTNIVLGRVDTGVGALKIPNDAATSIDLGTLFIKSHFNDFRDYAPYSSYNLYIPFIGTINLNPNDFLNKIITIKMIVDVTTGKATAIVYAAGIPMQYLDGMIGVDIPITSSNASEMVSSIINAVGYTAAAAASVASGNFVAAAGSLAAGATDVLFNDIGINKQGNVSPAASLSAPVNAYVVISRPTTVIPENYGHVNGYACDLTAPVSALSGFTVCNNVDTSGIAATERERNEIKTLMEGGIYL